MIVRKTVTRLPILLILPCILIACRFQEEATTADPGKLSEHDLLVAQEQTDFMSDFGDITEEERGVYGNRAGFFEWAASRPTRPLPDADWRSVLGESLSDAEPMWSQGYEELIIRDYFRDKRNGFFLDVGCYLPKNNSTTYYLEKMLGWTGIGIDAMEEYAPLWEEYRPKSTFLAFAVSDKDGETLTFHIGNFANSLEEEVVTSFGGKRGEIQVITMTLNTLLEQNGIKKVDFMSMDIEGAEPYALKGFDIQKYKPALCCVEGVNSDEVLQYFVSNNYELIEKYRKVDKINWYFRPKPGK